MPVAPNFGAISVYKELRAAERNSKNDCMSAKLLPSHQGEELANDFAFSQIALAVATSPESMAQRAS